MKKNGKKVKNINLTKDFTMKNLKNTIKHIKVRYIMKYLYWSYIKYKSPKNIFY
jgi:hypothetical protein